MIGIARLDERGRVLDLADRRNAQRSRDDGDMAVGPAFLEHEAAQARAVVVEEGGRAHGARHEDGVLRQRAVFADEGAPDQLMQEAVGEIVEVVQPIAQVGIALAQHAGAIVGLHALDGGLGRETGEHRLAHAAQPALVVGEHAESLEHLAVLAVMGDVAVLDELVDGGAHGADRLLQALDLDLHVLGDDLLHDHARLVQHHVAEPDAVGEADAALVERAAHREAGAGRRQGLQLARGDHLGEHHGGRLQRLDLFLRVGAVGPVLDVEHAESVAAAQDRHAEEAVIDLLARLRPVREGRMRLRIGEGERLGGAGDQADEAVPAGRVVRWTASRFSPSVA